jgi:hypothetical protein
VISHELNPGSTETESLAQIPWPPLLWAGFTGSHVWSCYRLETKSILEKSNINANGHILLIA